MPYIKTFSYEESEGKLREAYDEIIRSRGKLAEVHKIQSLIPKSMMAHMDFYITVMFSGSALKRYQREMIAVVVSAANQCLYCIEHHKEALHFYWKDELRLDNLLVDRNKANLSEVDEHLCDYAEILTVTPEESTEQVIEELRSVGLSDKAILDATQVISYFNFVNRMVMGLGVEFNEEEVKGYNY